MGRATIAALLLALTLPLLVTSYPALWAARSPCSAHPTHAGELPVLRSWASTG